jgi:hypothetical protein
METISENRQSNKRNPFNKIKAQQPDSGKGESKNGTSV